jgi:hypothetical protein
MEAWLSVHDYPTALNLFTSGMYGRVLSCYIRLYTLYIVELSYNLIILVTTSCRVCISSFTLMSYVFNNQLPFVEDRSRDTEYGSNASE